MKLYEVPRNSRVKVLEDQEGPPGASGFSKGDILNFHHVDGMYSYCHDSNGNTVHLKAWAEVEIVV